jgi:YEATS domain-containing protein 4
VEEYGWGEFEVNVVVRSALFHVLLREPGILHCLCIRCPWAMKALPQIALLLGGAQLHFADDAQEPPLEVFHKLKLYSDADPTNQSTKRPVNIMSNSCIAAGIRLLCTVTPISLAWPCSACPAFVQVVNEQYEELVFSEPVRSFYERVTNYMAPPAQPVPAIAQHFRTFGEAEDLHKINAARQRVAQLCASVQRQFDALA